MLSFVDQCVKGMCPVYVSMLKQPTEVIVTGIKTPKLWNDVDNKFKDVGNYDTWYKSYVFVFMNKQIGTIHSVLCYHLSFILE